MKLLFKQRAFAWFDSYDIYDENENTVYIVKGQLSWGHCLKIFDASEEHELGTVKEQIFSWWPQFELYEGSDCIGTLKKEPWGSSARRWGTPPSGYRRFLSASAILPCSGRSPVRVRCTAGCRR